MSPPCTVKISVSVLSGEPADMIASDPTHHHIICSRNLATIRPLSGTSASTARFQLRQGIHALVGRFLSNYYRAECLRTGTSKVSFPVRCRNSRHAASFQSNALISTPFGIGSTGKCASGSGSSAHRDRICRVVACGTLRCDL